MCNYNYKRRKWKQTHLLTLHESMPEWGKHTSNLDRTPNCELELIKTFPLGTMFRNGAG